MASLSSLNAGDPFPPAILKPKPFGSLINVVCTDIFCSTKSSVVSSGSGFFFCTASTGDVSVFLRSATFPALSNPDVNTDA